MKTEINTEASKLPDVYPRLGVYGKFKRPYVQLLPDGPWFAIAHTGGIPYAKEPASLHCVQIGPKELEMTLLPKGATITLTQE